MCSSDIGAVPHGIGRSMSSVSSISGPVLLEDFENREKEETGGSPNAVE